MSKNESGSMEGSLLPCPFCGSEEIAVDRMYINPISESSQPDSVHVYCVSCGIGGYTEETEQEAVECWNTRSQAGHKSTSANSDYTTTLKIIEEYENSKPKFFGIPPLKHFCRKRLHAEEPHGA